MCTTSGERGLDGGPRALDGHLGRVGRPRGKRILWQAELQGEFCSHGLFSFEKSWPSGMDSSNHGVYRTSFCRGPCHLAALEVWKDLPNEFQVLGKVSLTLFSHFFCDKRIN